MKKVVLYVRVSSREQKEEGYSIPAQKRLLWEFAKKNDFIIAEEFEDDETAKSAGRTGFGKMIEYIQKHKDVNTVLVEKTDRLYRNFKDYVTIDELGVTVFLVKENEVIGKDASSHQKLIHGIKVLMAKNYVDNLSEEVKKGNREKAEEGIFPCSMPPLGYKMGELKGRAGPVVDELNRGLVVSMFELYATGLYSLKGLIEKLYNEGMVIPANFPQSSKLKVITKSTVQRILSNHLYYGNFYWKGMVYNGLHTPLITKELWDRVQRVMNGNSTTNNAQVKQGAKQFLFRGIIRCGECGRTVSPDKKIKPSGKEYVYYRCTKYRSECSQKPIEETLLSEQLEKYLDRLNVPVEVADYIEQGLKESLEMKRATVDVERAGLEQKKQLFVDRLDALYEEKLDKKIGEDFYKRKFEEYSKQVDDLDVRLAKYKKADIEYYKFASTILELSKVAKDYYDLANTEERQVLLKFLLSNSTLKDGIWLIEYKKPFNFIFERSLNSDWRTGRDSNPQLLP